MKIITSLDNSLIKKIRSLSVKKYREQFALCLLEGDKVVLEAIKEPNLVEYLIITESQKAKYRDLIDKYENILLIVTEEIFKSLTHAVTPQNILAVIKIKESSKINPKDNLVVLDNLQDPGNLGTIIRSGVASGHTNFVLINSVDPYNEKTLRSATGTIFKANFYNFSKTQFCDFAMEKGLNILIANMGGENIFNKTFVPPKSYALVIGSEGQGVSEDIKKLKHKTIAIPMENNVESLNAGVSAGVIMFNLKNR